MVEHEVVVVASGYFDPLHVGHLEYLNMAKKLGDKLIVVVSRDAQTVIKKGKSFMLASDRKIILENLKCVDEVIMNIDIDQTTCKTLELIKPDIFAKGGDRFADEIPEGKICEELGIEIVDGLGNKIRSSRDFTGLK